MLTRTPAVPRGKAVRFEDDDLDDNDVLFLDNHDITVQDAEGYKIYHLRPKYTFKTTQLREAFLQRVRERVLLGRCRVDEIHSGGRLVARMTVVRFWRKEADDDGPTLAFLGRDAVQQEWHLSEFEQVPTAPQANVVGLLERHNSDETVVFVFGRPARSPGSPRHRRSFSFGSWRRRKSSTPSVVMVEGQQLNGDGGMPSASADGELGLAALEPVTEDDLQSDAERFRTLFRRHHPSTAIIAVQ